MTQNQEHTAKATANTPAMIIFLLDVSGSMNEKLPKSNGKSKITMVMEAYHACLKVLLRRSTKGEIVSPRYAIHLFAYNNQITDVYGETLPIGDIIQKELPRLNPTGYTCTYAAFEQALALLESKMPYVQDFPAPVVCHLTDGQFSDADPSPVVAKIRRLRTNDGPVLVSNIFVGEQLLAQPISDVEEWSGVQSANELISDPARFLYNISSPLPASYATNIQDEGYGLEAGVNMLFPASNIELVELAFVASTATN